MPPRNDQLTSNWPIAPFSYFTQPTALSSASIGCTRVSAQVKKEKQMTSYDDDYYLIKEEVLPNGEKKFIIKNKKTGSIEKR